MAKELGETNDPRELIPGDAASVAGTATALRARGDALHEAGAGLKRIDTADGWSGEAAEAFRARFDGEPSRWLEAGDCFHSAADALTDYSKMLIWAQQQAATAISQWNAAQNTTQQATAQHQQAEQQAGTALPFDDPGEAGRSTARDTLDSARQQLDGAGDTAAGTVGAVRDKAPKKPGFWSKVGDFFEDVGAGLANVGGHVANGLASFGNAMIHHPGDVAAAAAGAGLMIAGATGDVGGGLLDLTGVGAVIGVPINIASTAAVVAGGGIVVAGAGDLMMHATSDDGVSPARTDYEGAGGGEYEPTEGFRGSEFSKDEIVEFVNGHTGDGNVAMGRPTSAEVDAALTKAEPQKLPGQNAEKFEYNGVRVIVNYDMPWKSTTYYPGR
ncbi:putative T7SS-secreted protein [Actinoplanes sp. NPDC026619]|uniref:WXG100 family type VII secretion target n=1 Tax=Actinoplanes sp. NPDC026619 TaxID=3155798 RepID=UPI00340DD70F